MASRKCAMKLVVPLSWPGSPYRLNQSGPLCVSRLASFSTDCLHVQKRGE